MTPSLNTLIEFVEGRLETRFFEKQLYQDPELEQFLSNQRGPKYAHTAHTLYHYLIELNYRDPSDILVAQGAIADVLQALNIPATVSRQPSELLDLILSVQPKWLDVDALYIQNLLAQAPAFKSKVELKQWLKMRLLEMFRYAKKPPVWLQSPNWPIGKHGPLVFLGQVSVDGYFHDKGAAYVFHDSVSNECITVLQTC